MCLVNSLMVSGVFFLTQSRSKVKTQDTIDCETVPHVPDWVPRHDYLRPAIVGEF